MNITVARIIFTGSTTDALAETISRDDFAAGRRAIMATLRGTGVRMVKETKFGTALTSGGTRFAWNLYDGDTRAHVGHAWVDVVPVTAVYPVGSTVRNVYTGALSVVTGYERNAEGIVSVGTETTSGHASAYELVDAEELAEHAPVAEVETETPDSRSENVTTYFATRDSDAGHGDFHTAMAHVDIARGESFDDVAAALLGYMESEAQELAARPVVRDADKWAVERARAIRAGMDTVRSWSGETFANGTTYHRVYVKTRGLVFAIVRRVTTN